MSSKRELKTFLVGISNTAYFTTFDYESPEKFLVTMKCHVDEGCSGEAYSEITKDWLDKFSKFTRTTWIVRRSFPNLKRMRFRKVYACHHSGYNKTYTRDKKKNKDCRAIVDFKVKKINRNTIKNDECLRQGLNMHINIDFKHSHRVRTVESYNSLKCLPETDELFYKYIETGYTIPVARKYHEMIILCKYGPRAGEERLLNTNENPSLTHITYLYKKKKQTFAEPSLEKAMEDRKAILEERGAALSYVPSFNMTVIVTPFMKNVLRSLDLDIVIIDTCAIRNDLVVTYFFVPSELGALPIACAMYSDQSEPSFSQALFSIKLLLENTTLKSFDPQMFMINNIKEQMNACDAIFPGKKIILSHTSICEETWSLICEDKSTHNQKYKENTNTMHLFHSLLHSDNTELTEKIYTELVNNDLVKSIPKLKEYIDHVRVKRQEYILQTKNIILDMSIRILREFSMVKCKCFNLPVMVDVLMHILDNYWSRTVHCHLQRQSIAETYTLLLPKNKEVMKMNSQVDENIYCLEGDEKSMWREKHIHFTTNTWVCDCGVGRKGRLCEHLCAALHKVDINDLAIDIPEDKTAFYSEIAGESTAAEIEGTTYPVIEPIKIEIKNETTNNEDNISEIKVDVQNDTDSQTEENNDEDDTYYYVVQKQERNDPLEGGKGNDLEEPIDPVQVPRTEQQNNKTTYESALKNLNDEFRRLNKLFKSNPNVYNMDTMERLARELAKIRPLEKVNLSHMHVSTNSDNENMDTGD